MPEHLILALIQRAENWANRAGTTLARRNEWTPATFTSGRRPEERALLSAAAEVFDLVGATPLGCVLLQELRLNPEAGAMPTHDELAARYADHCTRVSTSTAPVCAGASA
jgi:hypothetical protein